MSQERKIFLTYCFADENISLVSLCVMGMYLAGIGLSLSLSLSKPVDLVFKRAIDTEENVLFVSF